MFTCQGIVPYPWSRDLPSGIVSLFLVSHVSGKYSLQGDHRGPSLLISWGREPPTPPTRNSTSKSFTV